MVLIKKIKSSKTILRALLAIPTPFRWLLWQLTTNFVAWSDSNLLSHRSGPKSPKLVSLAPNRVSAKTSFFFFFFSFPNKLSLHIPGIRIGVCFGVYFLVHHTHQHTIQPLPLHYYQMLKLVKAFWTQRTRSVWEKDGAWNNETGLW